MKKRIIPSILLNNGSNICLSKEFSPWRTIGALTQVLRLHVQRGADELLVINLDSAGMFDRLPSQRIFSIIRNEVDIPIAYAGGIASVETATACINSGFDKVYVTSAFLDNPEIVHKISDVIGVQSLGVCLPFRKRDEEYFVWDFRTRISANLNLSDAIHLAIGAGSGEILLYDIDADGSLRGLNPFIHSDLSLDKFSVPILLAGGAGENVHFSSALSQSNIQGVVAGSVFALTDATPLTIRQHCLDAGILMRRP